MARSREDEYEDDDRPRRRRDDDDDGPRGSQSKQLTGMDGMFANTNIVVLILFGLCCGEIALILGIVGLAVCKDEKAKQNAMIVTVISAILTVVHVGATIARFTILK
jgi:hypothetical protein